MKKMIVCSSEIKHYFPSAHSQNGAVVAPPLFSFHDRQNQRMTDVFEKRPLVSVLYFPPNYYRLQISLFWRQDVKFMLPSCLLSFRLLVTCLALPTTTLERDRENRVAISSTRTDADDRGWVLLKVDQKKYTSHT